jgi:hypothetical protein
LGAAFFFTSLVLMVVIFASFTTVVGLAGFLRALHVDVILELLLFFIVLMFHVTTRAGVFNVFFSVHISNIV